MNKTILTIVMINIGITLVLPALDGIESAHKYGGGVALTSLAIGGLDIGLGVLLAIVHAIQGTKMTAAQGFFLSAGILLLASFTLCTTSGVAL